ncbi:MAG TPA: glutamate formimidoyltransferase [Blastocatellia bacterium]|nr:glutamate formimidoyltransferase [Blastocatellia bacterium]
MRKIVECIPNFSEGRNAEVIDKITAAIKTVPETVLLDVESDPNHNRSVVTFVAPPTRVVDAALAGASKAAQLIDLNQHQGEHPRMGATDVIPFVPIAGVAMDDCIQLARECGERMWSELRIPVYLYEKAATRSERENLANIRKGQFEGIRSEIATVEARRPDFGDAMVHPTAGITAVGARPPLIAYNINLGTSDVEIANKIAKAVRYLSGGLRFVKALGFELKDRGIVQVSINMVNYEGTPLFRAFEMVKREAERYGVPVVGSEIVGLVPQKALNGCADFYLQLERFSEDQILENRLAAASGDAATASDNAASDEAASIAAAVDTRSGLSNSVGNFAALVAASTPTPGGGSVAAHAGMLAAALGQMVCNLSIGKKKYADVEPLLKEMRAELERLGDRLQSLIAEDAESFEAVMAAYRMPKETEEQKAARAAEIERATLEAAATPLKTAKRAIDVLRHLSALAEIGNPNAMSDVATAAQLALASAKGASYNVGINLSSLVDASAAADLRGKVERLVSEAVALAEQVESKMLQALSA